jgi:hypothetical protein
MSKRSREESRAQVLEGDNGLLHIQDLLSPGEEQDSATPAGANKKPRNFIATVVCSPSLVSMDNVNTRLEKGL